MSRLPVRTLVISGSMALAACATFFGFGPPRDALMVPHERHKGADVECVACHETIFDSEDLTTVDLPKEKKCFECHKEEKKNNQCDFCHTQPEKPMTAAVKERTLVFSHKKHLENEEIGEDCTKCHKVLPEPRKVLNLAPPMDACLSCHEHRQAYDEGRCEQCHQDLSRFPLKPLSNFAHKGDFLRGHPQLARSKPQSCATCHDQQFCSDCHAKTVAVKVETKLPERWDRLFVHRGDFVARHTLEVKADPVTCQRCHSTTFCSNCHTLQGLTPAGPPSLNPHGPGVTEPSAPDFHGKQARRDIVTCAACHDQGQASNCVTCHRVGGVGGNPHPASWLARHRREEIDQNAMCLTCHR